MPHKHKRRQNDSSIYDLPPNLVAKSLPVRDTTTKPNKGKNKNKSKPKPNSKDAKPTKPTASSTASREKSALEDDTPRAFRRLMQFQTQNQAQANKKRKRNADAASDSSSDSDSDSDNEKMKPNNKNTDANAGKNNNNNRKKGPAATTALSESTPGAETAVAAPKILPGEKLSDFAARVDRELPISGMKRSSKPSSSDLPNIREHRQTKHEKHLRRLQSQWREDDVKIREKEAAEREDREAEMEEQLDLWKEWEVEAGKGRAKKKGAPAGRKKKGNNSNNTEGGRDNEPDPWAKLKKKRANPFEQAQEPPQLKKPREVFKVKGGAKVDVANVPAAVGSLRRREELASERRNIVEEYRRLMAAKRG